MLIIEKISFMTYYVVKKTQNKKTIFETNFKNGISHFIELENWDKVGCPSSNTGKTWKSERVKMMYIRHILTVFELIIELIIESFTKNVFIVPLLSFVLQQKMCLEISQYSQENTCAGVPFLIKFTPAQVFSCEFCKISKNTFFY